MPEARRWLMSEECATYAVVSARPSSLLSSCRVLWASSVPWHRGDVSKLKMSLLFSKNADVVNVFKSSFPASQSLFNI